MQNITAEVNQSFNTQPQNELREGTNAVDVKQVPKQFTPYGPMPTTFTPYAPASSIPRYSAKQQNASASSSQQRYTSPVMPTTPSPSSFVPPTVLSSQSSTVAPVYGPSTTTAYELFVDVSSGAPISIQEEEEPEPFRYTAPLSAYVESSSPTPHRGAFTPYVPKAAPIAAVAVQYSSSLYDPQTVSYYTPSQVYSFQQPTPSAPEPISSEPCPCMYCLSAAHHHHQDPCQQPAAEEASRPTNVESSAHQHIEQQSMDKVLTTLANAPRVAPPHRSLNASVGGAAKEEPRRAKPTKETKPSHRDEHCVTGDTSRLNATSRQQHHHRQDHQEQSESPQGGKKSRVHGDGGKDYVTPRRTHRSDEDNSVKKPHSAEKPLAADKKGAAVPRDQTRDQTAVKAVIESSPLKAHQSSVYSVTVAGHCNRCMTVISHIKVASGSYVVFEGDRGVDMGVVQAVEAVKGATESFPKNTPMIVRSATKEEIDVWARELPSLAQTAVGDCNRCIEELRLDMRVEAASFQMDKQKLTFFYRTSAARVDFRKLLMEMFNKYRCRIWMVKTN